MVVKEQNVGPNVMCYTIIVIWPTQYAHKLIIKYCQLRIFMNMMIERNKGGLYYWFQHIIWLGVVIRIWYDHIEKLVFNYAK